MDASIPVDGNAVQSGLRDCAGTAHPSGAGPDPVMPVQPSVNCGAFRVLRLRRDHPGLRQICGNQRCETPTGPVTRPEPGLHLRARSRCCFCDTETAPIDGHAGHLFAKGPTVVPTARYPELYGQPLVVCAYIESWLQSPIFVGGSGRGAGASGLTERKVLSCLY